MPSPARGRALAYPPGHPPTTVLAARALVLPAGGAGDDAAARRGGRPPAAVQVISAEARELERTISSVGSLESPSTTTVASEVRGRLTLLDVPEGRRVEAGHVLARVDDSEARAARRDAKALIPLIEQIKGLGVETRGYACDAREKVSVDQTFALLEDDLGIPDLVVYNVAQAYSKLGRTDDSNQYFELLLARFPESSQAVDTFWRMASNYERVLELEKAVGYYEDLLTYHPKDDGSADALANAAFLKTGLKRFGDAANSFERYHDNYTDKEDAKDLLFKSAELWESAGNGGDARRVYKRWLKLYGGDDADGWVETQRKLADQALASGKRKQAEKIIQLIYDSYPNLKADLGGVGMRICAEIAFQPLLVEFADYEELMFPDSQDVEVLQKVFDRKLEWNKEIAASFDAFVSEYNDFEWGSAAFYYKALSFKRHGETWLQAPIPYDPDDPDEEEYFYLYSDKLSASAEPFENTAVQLFEQLVNTAKDKKRHNKWVDAALDELSRVDPNTYPVPKPERSTTIPSDSLTLPKAIEEAPELSQAPPSGSASRLAQRGRR